jgi:hypothetical protein
MKRSWLGLVLIIVIAGVVAWWMLRPRLSDRAQIEQTITSIEAGVERGSPAQVMENISSDYSDKAGLNYRKVGLIARRLLHSAGQIKADVTDYQDPRIEGSMAYMDLTVHASAYDNGQLTTSVSGSVKVVLRREGGWRKQWKVLNAEGWQEWAGGSYLE